jgi:hypothetical protein
MPPLLVRVLLVTGALVLPAGVGQAQPQIPSSFYGSVTIDGEAAPDGTEVRALIDGTDCSQSVPGERPAIREGGATVYVIHVVHQSQRPGCGLDGKTVTFTIAGRPAVQQATWKPGPQQLDLSAGTGGIVPLPTPTATVPGTQTGGPLTPARGTPTTLARPTGTPPTDDIRLPGTPSTPGGIDVTPAAGEAYVDADEGGPIAGMLVAAVAAIAAGGAGAGVFLARRRGRPSGGDHP